MYQDIQQAIVEANTIVIIQPENPDADSLGTSIALEEILSDLGKSVQMFCAIDLPKYLRYIDGWSRVSQDWTGQYDLAIIVDTASEALLEKSLQVAGFRHFVETHPTWIIDHHSDDSEANDLSFPHQKIINAQASATSEVVYEIASRVNWSINEASATAMLTSILGDTLGLSTPSVTVRTLEIVTELVRLGASPADIELSRREFMKKPADILDYKADLIKRIEYYHDGRLATVHIPWKDIEAYSDRYNPSVLVLDEMRLVEGVEVAVAIKTYPDGKLTGKIRSNMPISDQIAGYFGGGGHAYSAGFKIYEDYDQALQELLSAFDKTQVKEDK